jgi:hypothetical protein
MTRATQYVNHMYSLYDGRAAVTVGINRDSDCIHPFVFEDAGKVPIGLIALSADGVSHPADVDIYHISAFMPGTGQGAQIIKFLCDSADEYGVRLCIQASVQHNGNLTMTKPELIDWYVKCGFTGDRLMYREPVAKIELKIAHNS